MNHKLEDNSKSEGVSFVGISNFSLDSPKINNRTLFLSLPNLEDKLDQLKATSINIVKSISEDLPNENNKILIFNII